ncbi:type IV pilus twitching motility protein PilT [Chloroflexota bacterium]
MDVIDLISTAAKMNASDLQLVVDSPPLVRIHGNLQPISNLSLLTSDDIIQALSQITTAEERHIFAEELELDFGYTIPDLGRLRCNAAQQLNGISLAIRLLPPKIPTIDDLELPKIFKDLVTEQRGLILVCGPTDSGKSTSTAAMVHHLNTTGGHHIITIEDPIEYVHDGIKSAITQRQLGKHTHNFPQALRHVLRQNPDVIMVGEMRDLETAAAVLSIAETGHLILSTSHASSSPQAIERIVDMFPIHERHLAQTRLASLLIAVLCQTLVPRADGSGRIAVVEIMLASSSMRSLIREGKIYQLPNIIRTNRDIGMVSLDESLVDLYESGMIIWETVLDFCNDPNEVSKLISASVAARTKRSR